VNSSEGLDGVGDVVELAPIFCVHLYSIICQFPQKPRISKIPELITLQPFSIFMGGGVVTDNVPDVLGYLF
jgi:hypothetical protein